MPFAFRKAHSYPRIQESWLAWCACCAPIHEYARQHMLCSMFYTQPAIALAWRCARCPDVECHALHSGSTVACVRVLNWQRISKVKRIRGGMQRSTGKRRVLVQDQWNTEGQTYFCAEAKTSLGKSSQQACRNLKFQPFRIKWVPRKSMSSRNVVINHTVNERCAMLWNKA